MTFSNIKKQLPKLIFLIVFLFITTVGVVSFASAKTSCPDIQYCINLITGNEKKIADYVKKNKELQDEYNKIQSSYAWYQDGLNPFTPKRQRMTAIQREQTDNRDFSERLRIDNISYQEEIRVLGLAGITDPKKRAEEEKEINNLEQQFKDRASAATAAIKEEDQMFNDGACWSGIAGLNIGVCAMRLTGWVGTIATSIFALLLWSSSKIFDASVYLSISEINTWFQNDATVFLWKTMRDFSNIFFVFILLYIAIGTIFELNLSSIGKSTQKMIISVVIVALLVNFSGFFVRIAVDASNIIAYEFYSSLGGGGSGFKSISDDFIASILPDQYILKATTLQGASTEMGQTQPVQLTMSRLSFLGIIGSTFGNIIIILCASFVLIVASILFIIRSIVLLLIYIVSPIAFVSRLSPITGLNYFKKWSDTLIKQSFFAPAFLIPLFIVFTLVGKIGIVGLAGTSGTSGWSIIGGGIFSLAIVDTIIIGLFISCIFIAQTIGAIGLSFATGAAGKINSLASRNIIRTVGGAGRFVDRATGNAFSKSATGVSNIAGRVANRAGWNSDIMRELRETKTGQKIGQTIKNPLLTANDTIGSAAGLAGVKSFNVLGSSSESRKAAKDAEKEKKKKDRARKLETANQTDAKKIIDDMPDSEIKELPSKTLLRPEVMLNLDHDHLTAIHNAQSLKRSDRPKARNIVLGIPPEGNPANLGTTSGQNFMTTGRGVNWI